METTMSEEIQQLFKNLRQRKKAEMVEGELAAARETSPSYTDLLARLRRRSDSIKRKEDYKHAHLPEQWSPSPSSCNPGFRAAKSVNSTNRSSFPWHGVALFGHTSYNSPDNRLGPFSGVGRSGEGSCC
jgi:hypothetical protein